MWLIKLTYTERKDENHFLKNIGRKNFTFLMAKMSSTKITKTTDNGHTAANFAAVRPKISAYKFYRQTNLLGRIFFLPLTRHLSNIFYIAVVIFSTRLQWELPFYLQIFKWVGNRRYTHSLSIFYLFTTNIFYLYVYIYIYIYAIIN